MSEYTIIGYGRVGQAIKPYFEPSTVAITDETPARESVVKDRVVFLTVPGDARNEVLKTILPFKPKRVIDVSFVGNPLDLPDPATVCPCPVVVDAGFAPGMTNVLAALMKGRYKDTLNIYAAGLPKNQNVNRWGYVTSWNEDDLIHEYTREAWFLVKNDNPSISDPYRIGEIVARSVAPLEDGTETVQTPWGVFEGRRTDGLRTLMRNAPLLGFKSAAERTLRWPGFWGKLALQVKMGRKLRDIAKEWRGEPGIELVIAGVVTDTEWCWLRHETMARATAAGAVFINKLCELYGEMPNGVYTPELLTVMLKDEVDLWALLRDYIFIERPDVGRA